MPVTDLAGDGSVLTHCPFCALNCGLALEVESDRITGFRRWPDAPLTRGALCIKGRYAHEQIHHPDRLIRPLRQTGDGFSEIEWDEAFDRAAWGFRAIAARSGADANAVLSGGSLTNEKVYLIGKLARVALKTRHVDYNGRFCMSSASAAYLAAFGIDRMMTPLDHLDVAEVAVVVGANLSDAFPVRIPPMLEGVRRRGGRVIVIDPRSARFVKGDDLVVPLRPGSDATFFGGLLAELVRRDLHDAAFVARRTTGFAEAVRAVEHLTPEVVAARCDIDEGLLAEVAGLVGSAAKVMWLHGRGPEQQLNGVDNVSSIINVGLACGHVGRPGAGINMLTGQRNGQGGREWGQRCNQLPAGRDIENPAHRAVVARRWGVPVDELPGAGRSYVEILQMAGRGEIAGLLSICTNMSISSPDLNAVRRQLASLEHCVMIEPFFSESAKAADIIFPGTVFAEESGTITTLEGRVVRVDQATSPMPGLSDIDIITRLAALLGAGDHFAHDGPRGIYDEMCAISAGGPVDYRGIGWDRLRQEDGVFWPCPSHDHPGTPQLYTDRFGHEDGRARFRRVVPADRQPRPDVRTFPLVLTTGRALSQFLSANQTGRIPELNGPAPEPVLEVHPETATALALEAGRHVEITSELSTSVTAWRPNDRLRTDTVFMPYHWAECNRLIAADLDPISRIPGFKYTPVSVAPHAGLGEVTPVDRRPLAASPSRNTPHTVRTHSVSTVTSDGR